MGDPIQHRCGHLLVRKHLAPFAEGQVGGQDQAGALVQLTEQVEQQGATAFGKWQIALLVQDHGIDIDQPVGQLSGFAGRLLLLQLVDQIYHAVEAHTLASAHGVASQIDGLVGFPRAGSADQQDVMFCARNLSRSSARNCSGLTGEWRVSKLSRSWANGNLAMPIW